MPDQLTDEQLAEYRRATTEARDELNDRCIVLGAAWINYVTWHGNPASVLHLLDEITESRARIEDLRRDAGAAHGSAAALGARVAELRAQVEARDTRIAELEAVRPRFSQRQFAQAIRDRDEAQSRAAELAETCADFINQRVEYIQALRGSTDATDDYHRWSGGAEARRQLAERLNWTTPYEVGEKTAPKREPVTEEEVPDRA
ncbi:hypothetical protein NONO_c17660 [Nocardia nova SH22a]|uniref:Uncharacterized protein n=1 Tax=Nocardia nova SH22a TaxID=1415166 RepID=W5TH42_9NOCA|nr:hypothetical protein [Nocardia nova]AHH16566.1 hypothetical protein NONO_c17660 [Nocardia nova SH22a]